MGPLRIFLFLALVCLATSAKVPKPPGPKTPVYFPVLPEDFQEYGIRLSPSSGRVGADAPPSTTPKPTTTTMRLPIAQESHVAPKEITESPLAYLTDSLYYIPGRPSTPSPRKNQDISGQLPFEDDDVGPSSLDDLLDQDRFGLFFIGEHEAVSGSEEHFERVPFRSLYIAPHGLEEREEEGAALQSLPQYQPSSLSEASRLSVQVPDEPSYVYEAPAPTTTEATTSTQPRRSYGPPEESSSRGSAYIPARVTTRIAATTQAPYTPLEVTSRRRYSTPSTTTTTTRRPYSRPASSRRTSTTTSPGRRYTRPTTTTPEPSTRPTPIPTRSRNRYTTTTTRRPYRPRPTTTTTTTTIRPYRARSTSTSTTTPRPAGYRISAPEATHAIYFKPGDSDEKTRAKQTPIRKIVSRKPLLDYGARNLTVKGVSVKTSSSSNRSFKSRASSRASSTYKNPFSNIQEDESEEQTQTAPKSFGNRAESKYQGPVYTTADKSFRAPTTLYQGEDEQHKTKQLPEFIKAADNIYVPQEYDESSIPGEAGADYPNFARVPDTDFECEDQEHPGLYADTDTDCQVFHICQKSGQHDSFLCPNGTVFNQQYFVCDWWYNFACGNARDFFGLNEFIYELPQQSKY